MKRILGIVLIAASLTACNNKYKASSEERADSIKMMRDSLLLDSFKRVEQLKAEELRLEEERLEAERAAAATAAATTSRPRVVNNYYSNSTNTQVRQEKKGWSSAAKGAVIGGAAGAVGGALISKDRSKGAIIGGVAGAGTGYIIGRQKDKATGRAQ